VLTEIAYVLVKSEVGREIEVLARFKELSKVKEISAITGPYDYLIKIEGEDMKEIGNTLLYQLRQIPGVNDTLTMVVVATYQPKQSSPS